jgi:hypothetical protein
VSRRVVAVAVALALLAGCSHSRPKKTVIGVRKVALAMAFSDQALKTKVPPRIVVNLIPAPPEAIVAALPEAAAYMPPPSPTIPAPPKPPAAACPKAPTSPLPDPAPVAISTPPVAGTYLQQNKGTIKINGAVPLTLPYPTFSTIEIRDITAEDVFDPAALATVRKTSFTLEDQILPTTKIVSRYQYDALQVNLISREVVSGKQVTRVVTTPAVEVLGFGGPNSTWTSAGIDVSTATALSVQGSVVSQEPVDVCGKLVGTLRVSTDEQQVNGTTGEQSGTRAGTPTITNYATQLGGLPIRREQHTSQVVSTDAGPVSFDTDVVSTLVSTAPRPPGAKP